MFLEDPARPFVGKIASGEAGNGHGALYDQLGRGRDPQLGAFLLASRSADDRGCVDMGRASFTKPAYGILPCTFKVLHQAGRLT